MAEFFLRAARCAWLALIVACLCVCGVGLVLPGRTRRPPRLQVLCAAARAIFVVFSFHESFKPALTPLAALRSIFRSIKQAVQRTVSNGCWVVRIDKPVSGTVRQQSRTGVFTITAPKTLLWIWITQCVGLSSMYTLVCIWVVVETFETLWSFDTAN